MKFTSAHSHSKNKATSDRLRGALNHRAGIAAEEQVKRHYLDAGAECLAQRWRGDAGEIDLIFRTGTPLIFVEVKQSRTSRPANTYLLAPQIARITAAMQEYAEVHADGSLTEMRLDLACVDGAGYVTVTENILL